MKESKRALFILLEMLEDENRKTHSLKVSSLVEKICDFLKLEDNLKDSIVASAILHDIGYSKEITKTNFHPVDGYVFLKEKGYNKIVLDVVLHHTGAEELVKMTREDLLPHYNCSELEETSLLAVSIVSLADFHVNGYGVIVTPEERLEDIRVRHGSDSKIYIHAEEFLNEKLPKITDYIESLSA